MEVSIASTIILENTHKKICDQNPNRTKLTFIWAVNDVFFYPSVAPLTTVVGGGVLQPEMKVEHFDLVKNGPIVTFEWKAFTPGMSNQEIIVCETFIKQSPIVSAQSILKTLTKEEIDNVVQHRTEWATRTIENLNQRIRGYCRG